MHYTLIVTNTDKVKAKDQMRPFWEESRKDFIKHIEVENSEEGVQEWIEAEEKFLDSNKGVKDPWWSDWRKKIDKIKEKKTLKGKLNAIAKYEGFCKDKNGNLCSEYNPRGKWDYCDIGGRGFNWLVDKNGKPCNKCKVKDVDWDLVRKKEVDDARARYITNPELYNEFSRVNSLEEYIAGFDVEQAPFSVLHKGDWYDSDSEWQTVEEWVKWFRELMDKLDPDSEITIVDYHI